MTILSSDLPPNAHVVDANDAQYAYDVMSDRSVSITFTLDSPDSAYVLGACREKGVSIQTAVQEALVDWASR